jgi:putative ABC transport system ATP-binding protein
MSADEFPTQDGYFADAATAMPVAKPEAIVARGIEMVLSSGQQSIQVLKHIDWQIHQGDMHLLMGPSGSGKTTLLSVLAGLLTPTSGDVYLLGENITKISRTKQAAFRRRHIGFIFQDFNLFPALTAMENVETTLNLKGVWGREARQQAGMLLAKVGLADKARQLPRDLSGGQKQRVAIARALAGCPQIIMADEPTASLDAHSGHSVMELLRQLAKEEQATVLVVSHDPRIKDVADQVNYLDDGVLCQL